MKPYGTMQVISMADEEEEYSLHESVFNGEIDKVSKLLQNCDVAKKDKHGK